MRRQEEGGGGKFSRPQVFLIHYQPASTYVGIKDTYLSHVVPCLHGNH